MRNKNKYSNISYTQGLRARCGKEKGLCEVMRGKLRTSWKRKKAAKEVSSRVKRGPSSVQGEQQRVLRGGKSEPERSWSSQAKGMFTNS